MLISSYWECSIAVTGNAQFSMKTKLSLGLKFDILRIAQLNAQLQLLGMVISTYWECSIAITGNAQ